MESNVIDMEELAEVRGPKAYEESRKAAGKLVNNPDALEDFLNALEEKLKAVPQIGGYLSNLPVLVSMVRSYVVGEYPQLPIGTLIGMVTALIYFFSPIDILPDAIPGIGLLDDAMVIAVTMAFIGADVEAYKKWREKQNGIASEETAESKEE